MEVASLTNPYDPEGIHHPDAPARKPNHHIPRLSTYLSDLYTHAYVYLSTSGYCERFVFFAMMLSCLVVENKI